MHIFRRVEWLSQRQAGVLLHPSSLPGEYGIGTLGQEAIQFLDWLQNARVKVWQILPLNPPVSEDGVIPYSSWASLGGNSALLDLNTLVHNQLLTPHEVSIAQGPQGWINSQFVWDTRKKLFSLAALRAWRSPTWRPQLEEFLNHNPWVFEVAIFSALSNALGPDWTTWPVSIRDEMPQKILQSSAEARESIVPTWVRLDFQTEVMTQFFFEEQWRKIREAAKHRGIRIMGDIPIYLNQKSADVWLYRHLWNIASDGRLTVQAGVPPDAMSDNGQIWGVPTYNWELMSQDNYAWWKQRIKRATEHADIIRIDHFQAFSSYWEIPSNAQTARDGYWMPGPSKPFFDRIKQDLGPLSLCAEDLGYIDDGTRKLLAATNIPGMRVLHYGFGGESNNPHLPHMIPPYSVAYPGNHDNNTTLGWWNKLSPHTRTHVQHYFACSGHDIVWDLNRAALSSSAHLAVIQAQDLLALDESARMNDPASYTHPEARFNNWRWRLQPGQLTHELADRTRFYIELYGRTTDTNG